MKDGLTGIQVKPSTASITLPFSDYDAYPSISHSGTEAV
jgi:hypothetical protein